MNFELRRFFIVSKSVHLKTLCQLKIAQSKTKRTLESNLIFFCFKVGRSDNLELFCVTVPSHIWQYVINCDCTIFFQNATMCSSCFPVSSIIIIITVIYVLSLNRE